LKARDLIPGWPRGKSCSAPYGQDEGGYAAWWMKFRVRDPFELLRLEQDVEAELAYRRGQERMVTLYRHGLVETRSTIELLDWHKYEVPDEQEDRGYHTYLLPRDAIKGGMKLWSASTVDNSVTWQLVGPHSEVDRLLFSAYHTLRSYQFGNSAPDLAEEVADAIDEYRLRMSRKKLPIKGQ
jgi:hypothetical protein